MHADCRGSGLTVLWSWMYLDNQMRRPFLGLDLICLGIDVHSSVLWLDHGTLLTSAVQMPTPLQTAVYIKTSNGHIIPWVTEFRYLGTL